MQTTGLMAIIFAMLMIGALGALVLMPSGGERTAKRVQAISKAGRAKGGRGAVSPDASKDRRKQVQDTLKELEAKQKAQKKKLTLKRRIEMAGLDITVRFFFIMSFICGVFGFVAGLLAGQTLLVSLGFGFAAGFGVPRWFLGAMKNRRQKKFLEQFSNAIDVIVRGVKSGLPVNESLRIISRESPSPVREEFEELVESQKIGVSMEQALARFYDRMPLPEVNFFSIVLLLQQQTGGNLAEALNNLSEVLRGRKRMKGKIDAMSSEAKASAMIIGSLPFVVAGLFFVISPEYIMLMFQEKLGNLMLMAAGVWMLIGMLVMRAMINFKV